MSLKDKQHPVCEMPTAQQKEDYAFTRATIDMTNWKAKMSSLDPSIWEDENQEGNVKLTRPAHDAWGIKKIIFTFCDDFLLKILDLPWSQDPTWRPLLMQVYDAIGVSPNRVVRCLLASMPPGVKIPIHHDTGHWVKHTHRCHLAVETGEGVVFLVGPTEDKMKQVYFREGNITELNNQAKHAVSNNMDKHRIHLIFDYVDEDYSGDMQRTLLKPGEVVYQTRRSIDLARTVKEAVDSGDIRHNAPRFVIIGAQKAGTTSMYEYICQHPLVAKGKRRETHYFDWRYNDKLPAADAEAHYRWYMNFYEATALAKHQSIVTGESTPSYLFHSDIVIPRMKMTIPWAKVLVMLRNPTDRAFSQYQMCVDPNGTPEQLKVRGASAYGQMSFEEAVREEIACIQRVGVTPDCSFETFCNGVLKHCPMNHGGHSIVARGLYVLQLREWYAKWPNDQIKILSINDIKCAKATTITTTTADSSSDGQGESGVQQCMDDVFSYLSLPPIDIEDLSAKNTRAHGQKMSAEIRALLDDFYRPFNEALFAFLGKDSMQW